MNAVQFSAWGAEPTILELEKTVRSFDWQVPSSSFLARDHKSLENDIAYKETWRAFVEFKKVLESTSQHYEKWRGSEELENKFTDAVIKYQDLQSRFMLAYAKIAHAHEGYEDYFSWDHFSKLNLRLFIGSVSGYLKQRPFNLRHVDTKTLEIFQTEQDLQMIEMAALMNPKTEGQYLLMLQFSALRSAIVNRWGLDQAFFSSPQDQKIYYPTSSFLSLRNIDGKTITQWPAYKELNGDMLHQVVERLGSTISQVVMDNPITVSQGYESTARDHLLNSGYFDGHSMSGESTHQMFLNEMRTEFQQSFIKRWKLIANSVLLVSSYPSDSWNPEATVDRIIDTSFDYMTDYLAAKATEWMFKKGFEFIKQGENSDQKILEVNSRNKKFFDQLKPGWVAVVKPKMTQAMNDHKVEVWKAVKRDTQDAKVTSVLKGISSNLEIWKILLDIKNSKSAGMAYEISKPLESWKKLSLTSLEDVELYFFQKTPEAGRSKMPNDLISPFFLKLMEEFRDDASEGAWKMRIKTILKKMENEVAKDFGATSLAELHPPKTFSPYVPESAKAAKGRLEAEKPVRDIEELRGLLNRAFYLDSKGPEILRTVADFQAFALAKKNDLMTDVPILKLLRKDEVSRKRLQETLNQQRSDCSRRKLELRKQKFVDQEAVRYLCDPKLQDPDDLFMSLVRIAASAPSLLTQEVVRREMVYAYDQARRDSIGKFEKLAKIYPFQSSEKNENHRLLLQSTEMVRKSFIDSSEDLKKIDDSLMKATRSTIERQNDFLNDTVMYVFYGMIIAGAVMGTMASGGVAAPALISAIFSASVISLNVLGVANIYTRTAVDFFVLPPQLEYQVQLANIQSALARRDYHQGRSGMLAKKDQEKLARATQNGLDVDEALEQLDEQKFEAKIGLFVYTPMDALGLSEFTKIKPLTNLVVKPVSRTVTWMKARVLDVKPPKIKP